ncbi:hypothetical protein BX666DRAFT_2025168 [Dichotomocladium elegans]|nr:hypothetical protein BX666DRAFT_2025168 [Dichotomocladium elegans]
MTTNRAPPYLPPFFAEEGYFYDAPPSTSSPAPVPGDIAGAVAVDKTCTADSLPLERDGGLLKNQIHYSSSTSSVGLPSHNTRWEVAEDDLLREGIAQFGYGNWKMIADHVKTRNRLQCKNRARHWQTIGVSAADHPNRGPTSLSGRHSDAASEADPVKDSSAADGGCSPETPIPSSPLLNNTPAAKSEETAPGPGSVVDPIQFDRETISEHEKKSNPEWFTNRTTAKNPERYLKIRNHILDSWQTVYKPEYMTKTAARRGLRDCGDVNAIGRVHAYLENLGAINQGCEPRKPPVVKRPSRRVFYYYDSDEEDHPTSSKRKSRPDDDYDDQVTHTKGSKPRPRRMRKRPQHYYDAGSQDQDDQFCLVPVEDYEANELVAPFQLEITSNALVVMDFHSHLAHTEVIGLLGGRYLHADDGGTGQGTLYVETVFPCKGTSSTDIECEMDPESEMKAREDFANKGLSVVGWYHSHPTFEPNPSVRDIEYQNLYQGLFRDKATGIEPFIGVIVNPFDPDNVNDAPSRIQYVHIHQQWEGGRKRSVPYGCHPRIAQSTHIPDALVDQIKNLVDQFKDYGL